MSATNSARTPRDTMGEGATTCVFGRVFSWFPLGKQLQHAPLRCAQHVRRGCKILKMKTQNTRTGRQTAKPHTFQDTFLSSFFGSASWLFLLWWQTPADLCLGKERRNEHRQRLRRKCRCFKVGVALRPTSCVRDRPIQVARTPQAPECTKGVVATSLSSKIVEASKR